MKFNSHPYTLSLQYPSYSKFSQLSYESGCSHAFWCRECATWHWNKYVLIFIKLYFIHISKDILLLQAQKAVKQYKLYFSRKLLCQGLRKCNISKSAIMLGRTATSSIAHDFWKSRFWGRGKCKLLYRSEFYTHEYKNHHSEPEIYLLNICIQIKWTYETLFET